MSAARGIRMCFIGDSFVAGVGDPLHLGWVGRVAARAERRGLALTGYNLGVRMNTSADVRERWRGEAVPRFPAGCDNRLVFSFGVNDTTAEANGTRVPSKASTENLVKILGEVAVTGWPVLMIGAVPTADDQQNARTAALNDQFAAICRGHEVPYLDVFGKLDREPVWKAEAAAGDGSHPSAAGYERLSEIIFETWWAWTLR